MENNYMTITIEFIVNSVETCRLPIKNNSNKSTYINYLGTLLYGIQRKPSQFWSIECFINLETTLKD